MQRKSQTLRPQNSGLTGAQELDVYSTEVGTEQRTVKKLYVKVHSFELLGKLNSDEDTSQSQEPETHMEVVEGELMTVTKLPTVDKTATATATKKRA